MSNVLVHTYLVFHYVLDEQAYVEAYPQHGGLWQLDLLLRESMPPVTAFKVVSAPSRNQARRAAYITWIRDDGRDFYKWPYRAYVSSTQRGVSSD